VHTAFWRGNLTEGDHLYGPGLGEENNIKMGLEELRQEFVDLTTGTGVML
jgi:hypothetical protein